MLTYVALFSNIFIPLIYHLKPDQFDLSNLWCCFLQTLLNIAEVNKRLQAPAFLASASKSYTGFLSRRASLPDLALLNTAFHLVCTRCVQALSQCSSASALPLVSVLLAAISVCSISFSPSAARV